MKVFAKVLFVCLLAVGMVGSSFAADPGITSSKVKIGSSLVLEGAAEYLGQQMKVGLMSVVNEENSKGGVNGRKIEIIAYNDGYEPIPCVMNTKKLIEKDKVFALTCYVGTPTTVKAQSVWTNAKVPVVGFFTGAGALRKPFNRYNIHVRSSYNQECDAVITGLVNELGVRKVAVFYQFDAFGEAVKKGTELALQKFGLTPVAYGTYKRNTMEVSSGLKKILPSKPEAIVMVGTYSPLAKFVKEAKKAGLTKTVFHTVSFVGPEAMAKELGGNSKNVVITQVVPPYAASDLPVIKEYKKMLKKHFPKEKPNFVSLEGYVSGKVLVEGLKNMKSPTRESFIDAIESAGMLEIGGLKLNYGKTFHQGMSKVYVTRVKNGEWVEVTDWSVFK